MITFTFYFPGCLAPLLDPDRVTEALKVARMAYDVFTTASRQASPRV